MSDTARDPVGTRRPATGAWAILFEPRTVSWACATLALLALVGGCDDAVRPYRGNGLTGEYALVAISNWPLPYYDTKTGEVSASTIRLWSNQTYEHVERGSFDRDSITTGLFFPRGDRVVLVPEDGRALSYGIAEGELNGAGWLYVDVALGVPAKYRNTHYRLSSCSGSQPSVEAPCPGGVIESRIWLGDTGTYWLQDYRANGNRLRGMQSYAIAGNVITLNGRGNLDRYVGGYTPDTLTFDGWVYAQAE